MKTVDFMETIATCDLNIDRWADLLFKRNLLFMPYLLGSLMRAFIVKTMVWPIFLLPYECFFSLKGF